MEAGGDRDPRQRPEERGGAGRAGSGVGKRKWSRASCRARGRRSRRWSAAHRGASAREPPLSGKLGRDYSRDQTREAGDLGHTRPESAGGTSGIAVPGPGVGGVSERCSWEGNDGVVRGAAPRPPLARLSLDLLAWRSGSLLQPPGLQFAAPRSLLKRAECHPRPQVQRHYPQTGHSGSTPQQRCGREGEECCVVQLRADLQGEETRVGAPKISKSALYRSELGSLEPVPHPSPGHTVIPSWP